MKQDLFRRTALNAMASPEPFSEILWVTSPKDGAVFIGIFLMIASAGLSRPPVRSGRIGAHSAAGSGGWLSVFSLVSRHYY